MGQVQLLDYFWSGVVHSPGSKKQCPGMVCLEAAVLAVWVSHVRGNKRIAGMILFSRMYVQQ